MNQARKQILACIVMSIVIGIATAYVYREMHPQWIIFRKAEAEYHKGQWQNAINLYSQSLSNGLQYPKAMLHIADSYMAVGNFAEAIHWYNEYLNYIPQDKDARRSLADAYLWNNDIQSAETELNRILKEQ